MADAQRVIATLQQQIGVQAAQIAILQVELAETREQLELMQAAEHAGVPASALVPIEEDLSHGS